MNWVAVRGSLILLTIHFLSRWAKSVYGSGVWNVFGGGKWGFTNRGGGDSMVWYLINL